MPFKKYVTEAIKIKSKNQRISSKNINSVLSSLFYDIEDNNNCNRNIILEKILNRYNNFVNQRLEPDDFIDLSVDDYNESIIKLLNDIMDEFLYNSKHCRKILSSVIDNNL